MTLLKTIWAEVLGLFVDDGRFALTILIWLAACGLILPHLPLPALAPPVLLALGLAVILADSAIRAARKRRAP
jgi:hypothetical protein